MIELILATDFDFIAYNYEQNGLFLGGGGSFFHVNGVFGI